MEAFLLGDQGPDVFYEVQDSVVDVLQDKYYPLFISSENYSKMIAAMEEAALNNNDNNECNLNDLISVIFLTSVQILDEQDSPSLDSGIGSSLSSTGVEPPNCSRRKLMQLEEKLITKRQVCHCFFLCSVVTFKATSFNTGFASFENVSEARIQSSSCSGARGRPARRRAPTARSAFD